MTPPLRFEVVTWPVPDLRDRLATQDAGVLTAYLGGDELDVASAVQLLDRDERQRYDEYANVTVARRFAVGRSILRAVLGLITDVAPVDVALQVGVHGKPKLAASAGAEPLWFSSAHSEELYVVAVSSVGDVGVDIERHRAIEQWERVADRVLDAAERSDLAVAVAHGEEPGQAFLRHWCRVEAELKAVGSGIAGLEAHRAGQRPSGLRLAECDVGTPPGGMEGEAPRYQLAVALCSPSRGSEFQMNLASAQAPTPVNSPATASIA